MNTYLGQVENFSEPVPTFSTFSENFSTLIDPVLFEDGDTIFDDPYVRYGFVVLYTVVFCLCFFGTSSLIVIDSTGGLAFGIGNLAVVLVVMLHWRMRSITKFCLGNLAFANLCVGIFCIYQNLSTFLIDRWLFGHFMCKMYHFINSLSHTASILILVVICVERYLAILHPFKSKRWITLSRLRISIITVWILSAVMCSPRLYYINIISFPVTDSSDRLLRYDMICAPQHSLYNAPIMDMTYFILLFLLPLLVISILYARIGLNIWRGSSRMVELSHRNHPHSTQNISPVKSPPESPPSTTKDSESYEMTALSKDRSSNDSKKYSFSSDLSGVSGLEELHEIINEFPELNFQENGFDSDGSMSTFKESAKIKKKKKSPSKNKKRAGDKSKEKFRIVKVEMSVTCTKPRQAVLRMLIVIVATFAICNLPFHIRKICISYLPDYEIGSEFSNISAPLTFLLMYANCAINPIIYAFMSKGFRSSLVDLIKCQFRRKKRSFHTRSSLV